ADLACASGRRYSSYSAPPLAGQCVVESDMSVGGGGDLAVTDLGGGGGVDFAGGNVLFAADFESLPLDTSWIEGSQHGDWKTVYTGFGKAGIETDGTKVLMESPMAATMPSETHAGLLVSIPTFDDLDVTVRMKTVRQLRTNS